MCESFVVLGKLAGNDGVLAALSVEAVREVDKTGMGFSFGIVVEYTGKIARRSNVFTRDEERGRETLRIRFGLPGCSIEYNLHMHILPFEMEIHRAY